MRTKNQKPQNRVRLSHALFQLESRAEKVLGAKVGDEESNRWAAEMEPFLIRGTHLLKDAFEAECATLSSPSEIEAVQTNAKVVEIFSFTDVLNSAMNEVKLDPLTRAKFLATLALTLIGRISDDFKWPVRTDGLVKLSDAIKVVDVAAWGMDATAAVSEAERLMIPSQGNSDNYMAIIETGIRARRTEQARRAALTMHAENIALRDQAFAWCDQNMEGKTIDEGAVALEKVIPLKLSTRRTYVIAWRKARKQQSASSLTIVQGD